MNYNHISISEKQAANIVKELYGISASAKALAGEIDFNFRIKAAGKNYLLKVSRPDADMEYLDFQQSLLEHVQKTKIVTDSPKILKTKKGEKSTTTTDSSGNIRVVRLISWIEGRLWSAVNPVNNNLLFSLGEQAAHITLSLNTFDHVHAHRAFQWDISQASWTFEHLHLFDGKQKQIAAFFQGKYKSILPGLETLRKGVVHNDVNDNNIIVTNDLLNPKVKSVIDYGDAIYTAIINDLAIAIAYAIMNKPDPLQAALPLIQGYNKTYPLQDEELKMLYVLVAMRLIISVCKSAINKQKEPQNKYLLISEKAAWDLLERWYEINEDMAYYYFRACCGKSAHPNEELFTKWAANTPCKLTDLFPTLSFNSLYTIDLSVGSNWLGSKAEIQDPELNLYKIKHLYNEYPQHLISGGYLETRSLYSTASFKKESNDGPAYRTVHLGIDFWVEAGTAIHSLFDGEVFNLINNDLNKDFGPTLILKHKLQDFTFFSLYGHLSQSTLSLLKQGQSINKGDPIGYIGNSEENGNWTPHLHFQLILDILGNRDNFPGVTFPAEVQVWKSICPDPNLLFKEKELELKDDLAAQEIISYRKQHLGKSLSLSYNTPLKMLRGDGVYLIDGTGRKYLDTVNNVAHVGHEHPRVVKAGKDQMSVLNTNTRYLHQNIKNFAQELLSTFPKKLSVVHFVNSGSEANELAMRMAKNYTNQKDFIALEMGYHGNTGGCIDISSYKFDRKGGKGAPENTHIVPLPDSFRGIYRGTDNAAKYAAHIPQQIDNIKSKGRGLAAFISESILSCAGQIELPKGYLNASYTAVRKAGGICIADEVQVGCGRTGSAYWGFQLHNVIPDIVTIGKPIGNGHPLAAVVCTQEIAAAFADGMEYFNTFGGNPVSCAIGLEVLRVIKDEKLQQNAHTIGNYLIHQLKDIQKEFPVFGDIRGQGLFLGIELVDSKLNPLPDKAHYLVNRMKDYGILMSIDGRDNNVLKIKPPMVFSKANADELIYRLKIVVREDYLQEF